MTEKVLITGFEPFDDKTTNPSYEAVMRLPETIAGATIVKMELPSVFHESLQSVIGKIKAEQPDIVILVGLGEKAKSIRIERVAINIDDARIPDNKGNQPVDAPIIKNDLPAYFSTLPIKAIADQLSKNGIPAEVSNSAGTYVCNHVMFGMLSYISHEQLNIKCGFIHVPYTPEMVEADEVNQTMTLIDITKALEEAVKTTLKELTAHTAMN